MKASERKRLLIEEGLRLFKARGYDEVSVEDICAAVHVSKPTFYNRVGRKEMILVEYFRQKSEEALETTRKLLSENRLIEGFQTVFNSLHETAMEMGPELFSVYFHYLLDHPVVGYALYEKQVSVISDGIRRLQEQKLVGTRQNPDHLAATIIQIDDGLSIFWAGQNGHFDLSKIFRKWMQILLGIHIEGDRFVVSEILP